MVRSVKYRLRPTKKQENILLAHIEECRLLYNQLVCSRVQAWEKEKSLARAQRKWDAMKKRPKTDAVREKRRKVIARVHERIRNKRHNFAHQESRKIVNRHGFVAVEKLKVKKMQKNRRLSKSIADVAWLLFRHCLEYKAEEAGIGFKAVKPDYTSQDCSACGHREKKSLSDRVHHCKACGYTTDRDHNAAINILTLGLQRQVECMCPNDFIG